MHVSPWRGKRLLRRALRRSIPDRILDARKRGFEVPVGDWLAGPLAEPFHEIVTAARLEEIADLDGGVAATWFNDHRQRRADRGKALWALYVLCHWHEHVRVRRPDGIGAAGPLVRAVGGGAGAALS
jgi:asparagine synthase (glutamine-hydrolysing)